MAHVHFPFHVEEVSFLVITMVCGRRFPAESNGKETEKEVGHPSHNAHRRAFFTSSSSYRFLENVCLKIVSMIISLTHFEISFLLGSH